MHESENFIEEMNPCGGEKHSKKQLLKQRLGFAGENFLIKCLVLHLLCRIAQRNRKNFFAKFLLHGRKTVKTERVGKADNGCFTDGNIFAELCEGCVAEFIFIIQNIFGNFSLTCG